MSTENTESTEETPEVPADDTTEDTGTDVQGSGSEETPDSEEIDADKLLAERNSLRKEAAKYRVKYREASDALAAAKTPAEFEAVQTRMTELETELSRERLARKYNLPEAIASRIAGDDDESREEDAKSLASLFNKPSGIGSGGLDPTKGKTTTDPAALMKNIPRARR